MQLINRIIEYSFYAIFFFVPLVFAANTSELFEFNKMWFTFGLTIIIATAWFTKMILQSRLFIQRTPLDIPIILFLLSQIISTIFSLDSFVSWWGYYSRWNGGLLSTFCYIFLYYAFVSNFSNNHEEKKPYGLKYFLFSLTFTLIVSLGILILGASTSAFLSLCLLTIFFSTTWILPGGAVAKNISISLVSGFLVALWGFPAHFGYDPTCLVFRGTLDTSCWTDAFKPTIRTFSTLGQPAWEAAYMAVLLPLTIAYALKQVKILSGKFILFLFLTTLFYLSLNFANTRAGFIGFFGADIVLWGLLLVKHVLTRRFLLSSFIIFHTIIFICSFFFGMPFGFLQKLTFVEMTKPVAAPVTQQVQTKAAPVPAVESGVNITDSADIRKLVWEGAITAWKDHPIFGTGVETFAFAYYKYKSPAHNLTSEWDYLYNKAHNEYLNYLTTTGIFGLGSYLLFLALFVFQFLKYIFSKSFSEHITQHKKHADAQQWEAGLLPIALVTSWVSILVTNFFGFSVVIMNIYLFLIPAFIFILVDLLDPDKAIVFGSSSSKHINPYQWTAVGILIVLAFFPMLGLFQYWYADVAYGLGNNLDKVGGYQQAYPQLLQAVNTEPSEPVYKDEMAINLATLASALYIQKDTQNGAQFAKNAIDLNTQVVTEHPNNVVYWKNRVRLFYTLAENDKDNQRIYTDEALKAIDKAAELAPNDAKISYNQGVLHGQAGDVKKGMAILEQTIKLKPDYRDAYYALGLFYHQLAVDKDNKVVDPSMQQKAVETYKYILAHISPKDKQIQDSLKSWDAGEN